MARKQKVIEIDDSDEEILAQLKLMTHYLSRLETVMEDVVRLLARSQISPS